MRSKDPNFPIFDIRMGVISDLEALNDEESGVEGEEVPEELIPTTSGAASQKKACVVEEDVEDDDEEDEENDGSSYEGSDGNDSYDGED